MSPKPAHGMSGTSIHNRWMQMISRCTIQTHRLYNHYGGRGIMVCERWKDFSNFYEDMGDPPKGYTLDRIDNNGNYEPGNCEWVHNSIQHNNKRSNIIITLDGETLTLKQWARKLNVAYSMLLMRYRRGWTLERMFEFRLKKLP